MWNVMYCSYCSLVLNYNASVFIDVFVQCPMYLRCAQTTAHITVYIGFDCILS